MKTSHTLTRRDFLATVAAGAAGRMLCDDRSALAGTGQNKNRQAKQPSRLRAGAATSDITPAKGVSLDGYIMQIGPVSHVHDKLHARCLVLDDGSRRVAIVVNDVTVIPRRVCEMAKELAHRATGLPTDRVLISATHTHSAPRVGIGQAEPDKQYEQFLARQIAAAIRQAIDNLAPAKVGWGVGQQPQLVFNRRWLMKPGTVLTDPFGNKTDRVKMNPPRGSDALLEPAGPVDPAVSFLCVRHADGRPLALVANFGFHYAGGVKRGDVSADYFGVFAGQIGKLLGAEGVDPPFVGVMSNGTSGDISNGFDFRKPAPRKAPYAWIGEVGRSLAEEVHRVERQIEYRDSLSLAMRQTEINLGVRRPDEKRLEWARDIRSKAKQKQGKKRLSRPEIYARETILLSQFPPTVPLKLQALRIGKLGIAAIPCEVFAETGLAIQEASPLEPTFIIELANQYNGYLPTPRQHRLGGYETWPARSSCLEVEAEPKIRAAVLELLREVSRAG